jgi:capsular exopolysaccharide synthesis family protein
LETVVSRFYDAMRRAFSDEADTEPDLRIREASSDKTDPEIELEKIEAQIAAAKHESTTTAKAPVPIMGRFYDAMRQAFSADEDTMPYEVADGSSPRLTGPDIEPVHIEEVVESVRRPGPEAPPPPTPIRPDVTATRPVQRPSQSEAIKPPYERIIQRLLAFRGGRRHCVILVASAVPREGASTVAGDLAKSLALRGDGNVVLVDANMRRPAQHLTFEIDATEGLANVLRDDVKTDAVLNKLPKSGLTVMGAGDVEDVSSQLITVSSIQKVLTSLQSRFDWVLIDGPPVTTYPDSSNLAAVADGAILVLRAEQTRWEVAEEAKKILQQTGVNLLGGVLNRRKYHIPEIIYKRL